MPRPVQEGPLTGLPSRGRMGEAEGEKMKRDEVRETRILRVHIVQPLQIFGSEAVKIFFERLFLR